MRIALPRATVFASRFVRRDFQWPRPCHQGALGRVGDVVAFLTRRVAVYPILCARRPVRFGISMFKSRTRFEYFSTNELIKKVRWEAAAIRHEPTKKRIVKWG